MWAADKRTWSSWTLDGRLISVLVLVAGVVLLVAAGYPHELFISSRASTAAVYHISAYVAF